MQMSSITPPQPTSVLDKKKRQGRPVHERRPAWAVHFDAAKRAFAWRFLSDRVPYFLVAEFPKSGGTWLAQLLAEYLGVELPRNKSISILQPTTAVLHGHFLHNRSYSNVVCLLRDGRDIVVSAYHHMLSLNAHTGAGKRIRSDLGIDVASDIRSNLPAFIEYCFTKAPLGGIRFRFLNVTWRTFVFSWIDANGTIVTYEEMLRDTVGTLAGIVESLTNEKCDYDRARQVVDTTRSKSRPHASPGKRTRGAF